jgi:hypothetical protein
MLQQQQTVRAKLRCYAAADYWPGWLVVVLFRQQFNWQNLLPAGLLISGLVVILYVIGKTHAFTAAPVAASETGALQTLNK